MRRILITIPALAIVIFAVVNRGLVPVDLWPLPYSSLEVQIWLLALGPFLVGIMVGGMAVRWGWQKGPSRQPEKMAQDVAVVANPSSPGRESAFAAPDLPGDIPGLRLSPFGFGRRRGKLPDG